MNILFSTTYYDPYVSGLSLYVKRLAHALAKNRKHAICVLCMRHDTSVPKKDTRVGVRVARADYWMKMSKGFLSLDFIRQATREVPVADVVVVNLPQFEGVIAAMLGRLYHKKVIAVYHCEVLLPVGVVNRIIQSLLEISNMLTLLMAHHVVTYTKDFAKNSRLLRSYAVQTVYPPVLPPNVRQSVAVKIKEKIGNTDVVIGVAARLAAEKGLEYLFEAMPLLQLQAKRKKLKVVVAGPLEPVGEEVYKKKIMSLVQRYHEDIVFLGTLAEEDMGSFYSLLDILVLPSVNSTESFGMVQVEAMMTGVPVIATDLPGVRVPVRVTGMGIIVRPRDSGSLASAVGDILNNRSRYIKSKDSIVKEFPEYVTVAFFEKLFL